MKKKIGLFLSFIILSACLCINIWQTYRFQSVETQIVLLQKEQKALIEKNKRLMTAVAIYSSPSRVGQLADDLGLKKIKEEDVLILRNSYDE